jgi:hypothetical protein
MKPRINQFASQFQRRLAGASGTLLMLIVGQTGLAQQRASTPQASTASIAEEKQPAGSSASLHRASNGAIKVHGHWVIDLKNPDGTVADHREFENSLAIQQGGDALLIGMLAGYYVPGDFGILLQGAACGASNPGGCAIVKSLSTMPGSLVCKPGNVAACNASLTYNFVLAPSSGSTSIVLAGSVAAPNTGTITTVSTFFNGCDSANGYTGKTLPIVPTAPSTFPPANCVGSSTSALVGVLTATSSFTPLQVTSTGQLVHVTVTITFS